VLISPVAGIIISSWCAYLTVAVDPPLEPKMEGDGYEESDWTIHDPSRVIIMNNGGAHMIAATGKENAVGYDCGIETWWRPENGRGNWRPGQCLFTTKPAWVEEVAPGQGGAYWAPELVDENVLLWSFSQGFNDDSAMTCVGVATSIGDLNEMTWTDAGKPMFCITKKDYVEERSAIDPSVFTGFDGKTYLVTGGGYIIGTELDSTTYMPKSGTWFSTTDESWIELARGPIDMDLAPDRRLNGEQEDGEFGWAEAAYVWPKIVDGVQYYFLFLNWGRCCSGVDSTYQIRVGRSVNPMGPFVDKNGDSLMNGGGSLLLKETGYMIGPGHMGTYERDNIDIMTFHYYDSRRAVAWYTGLPWIAERELTIENGWPVAGTLLSSHGDNSVPTLSPVVDDDEEIECEEQKKTKFFLKKKDNSKPTIKTCKWLAKKNKKGEKQRRQVKKICKKKKGYEDGENNYILPAREACMITCKVCPNTDKD